MVQGLDIDHTYLAGAADAATARGGTLTLQRAIASIIVMSADTSRITGASKADIDA